MQIVSNRTTEETDIIYSDYTNGKNKGREYLRACKRKKDR